MLELLVAQCIIKINSFLCTLTLTRACWGVECIAPRIHELSNKLK
jgi:hypothetical protein